MPALTELAPDRLLGAGICKPVGQKPPADRAVFGQLLRRKRLGNRLKAFNQTAVKLPGDTPTLVLLAQIPRIAKAFLPVHVCLELKRSIVRSYIENARIFRQIDRNCVPQLGRRPSLVWIIATIDKLHKHRVC
jgi:hypothetical protein